MSTDNKKLLDASRGVGTPSKNPQKNKRQLQLRLYCLIWQYVSFQVPSFLEAKCNRKGAGSLLLSKRELKPIESICLADRLLLAKQRNIKQDRLVVSNSFLYSDVGSIPTTSIFNSIGGK